MCTLLAPSLFGNASAHRILVVVRYVYSQGLVRVYVPNTLFSDSEREPSETEVAAVPEVTASSAGPASSGRSNTRSLRPLDEFFKVVIARINNVKNHRKYVSDGVLQIEASSLIFGLNL